MGIPFTGVTAGKGVMLSDLNIANLKNSISPGTADHIMLWVADDSGVWGYEDWYYYNATKGWVLSGKSTTTFASVHPDGLEAGTGYWFYSNKANSNARTITTSGQVPSEDYVDMTIRCNAMNFICYPYPANLKLNDATMVDWSNSKKSIAASSADQIMIWIDKGDGKWNYETWYYYNTTKGWVLNGKSTVKFEDYHPDGIDVSKGFWYQAKAQTGKETITLRFKSPIASAE